MAEEQQEDKSEDKPARKASASGFKTKLLFGLAGLLIIGSIGGLFIYGMSVMTAMPDHADQALRDRLAATKSFAPQKPEENPDNLSAEAEVQGTDLDGDGVIDFNGPDYRYFPFQAPFLSNLRDSRKLLTLELALSIKRPAFFVDAGLDELFDLEPALRSVILNYLITLSPDQLVTRQDRENLARNIRTLLNDYLQPDNSTETPGIFDVHIQKLVVA